MATRRLSLQLLAATTVMAVVAGCASGPIDQPSTDRTLRAGFDPDGRATRPNIVLVMADDMRVDDMRYAPNLRRLVGRNGLTFRNSFSPYPLCCPARASLLTGSYAHNHHVWWHARPYGYAVFDDSHTVATALRAAGYRTGLVGKYLNGYGTMRSLVTGRPSGALCAARVV